MEGASPGTVRGAAIVAKLAKLAKAILATENAPNIIIVITASVDPVSTVIAGSSTVATSQTTFFATTTASTGIGVPRHNHRGDRV